MENEQGLPETTKDLDQKAPDGFINSKLRFLLIAFAAVAAIGLTVGLTVGLTLDDSVERKSAAASIPVASRQSLNRKYNSCEDMVPDLKLMARILANQTIQDNSYYWRYYYEYADVDEEADSVMAAPMAEMSAASGRGSAEGGHSSISTDESSFETNNQVEGVSEPDIVKSDGNFVWTVYGTEIVKIAAENVTVASRTQIPQDEEKDRRYSCGDARITGMLLVGEDRLVVFTAPGYCNYRGPFRRQLSQYWGGWDANIVSDSNLGVLVYNKDTMELIAQMKLKGDYETSRAIGDHVHVVARTSLNYYGAFLRHLFPWVVARRGTTKEEYEQLAWAEVEKRIDDFVFELTEALDCETIQQLTLMQNTDTITRYGSYFQSISHIHSFDIGGATDVATTSMVQMNSGWTVYASRSQLVLATRGYWFSRDATQQTYLVTYRLDGAEATFQGLGSVPGFVLNQFSMDHQSKNDKDYLRVATTTNARWVWEDGEMKVESDSTSQVTILELTDGDLVQVGQVTGLGKELETIQSVRFMGDRGYVVTFRQQDPFYTLDLSDPTKPRKVGELEIPGMSSYLHPINEDLLLGVGQDADKSGRLIGTQIALFDVSTFDAPQRIQNYTIPRGNSEAEWDHKAFRYLEQSQLLILPLTIYPRWNPWRFEEDDEDNDEDDSPFDGFRIFLVNETVIEPYHSIEHETNFRGCWSSAWLTPRSLVFGGDVMTMKGHSVLSHDLTERLRDAEPLNLDAGLEDNCHYYFPDWGMIAE